MSVEKYVELMAEYLVNPEGPEADRILGELDDAWIAMTDNDRDYVRDRHRSGGASSKGDPK